MARRVGPPFSCESVKMEGFFLSAHFVSCVRVGSKASGSIQIGGILAQMCECVGALRVTHLHMRQNLIFALRCPNMGLLTNSQDA